ncbi:MAG: SDR family oxidoreductase [Ruminococcus flavefaciens]|nr:SDR family oxidoreductase [Ruminococcus flavefaciens]
MDYSKLFSLDGRGAVITGGAGYLGRKIVQGLLDFGASVVVADYFEVQKEEIIEDTSHIDKLHVLSCNLDETASIKDMFAQAEVLLPGIHILINCAANLGAGVVMGIEDMDDNYWKKGIDGTIGYTFRTIREAIPYMKKCHNASIINFGSLYAVGAPDPRTYEDTPFSSTPNYGAGKAATVELTKYCAAYLAKYGIRSNSVSPGSYPHENVQKNEVFKKRLAEKTMLGRIGYPEDLIGAVIFLASDASAYITGINIMVDGGQTAW